MVEYELLSISYSFTIGLSDEIEECNFNAQLIIKLTYLIVSSEEEGSSSVRKSSRVK
jgi:hypothetical protein